MLNYECKIESKSPVLRELKINVKPESIQAYIDKQFKSLQKTVKLKGFRQGKVPLNLLRQYYLNDVKSDVYSKLIRDSYLQALEENKLLAVGLPEIEAVSGADLEDGKSLEFVAKIEVFPEFPTPDLSKISVKRDSDKLEESEVTQQLDRIRESHSELVVDEANSGPIKTGDFVEISFKGSVDGEELASLKAENRLIEIGQKQFMQEFEDALIGMKKGESKSFPLNFPSEFGDKKLAGKTATMEVTVHEFKKKQLPKLDDEFAKQFKLDSAEELKKKVREDLQERKRTEVEEKLKEDLLKALIEKNTFDVPKTMVKSQYDHLVEQNRRSWEQQGVKMDKIPEDIQQKLSKLAEDQVRASLILNKIADENKIKVEPADFEHEYSKMAERINLPVEQIKEIYERDENAIKQLRYRLKENRTVDFILSQVKVG